MLTTRFLPFPAFQTNRLYLRQILLNDAPALHAIRSEQEVMQYIQRPLSKSVSEAATLINTITRNIESGDGITWAITLKGQAQLLGTIGFWNMQKENYRAEIGYLLHPNVQRQGIMHEALQKVIRYGFLTMGLHSIEATVNPENLASIHLLNKNNFILEGSFKENYFFENKFYDSRVYSLINPYQQTVSGGILNFARNK